MLAKKRLMPGTELIPTGKEASDHQEVQRIDLASSDLSVSIEQVARYFGGSKYNPNAKTRAVIASAIEEACLLIEPVAVFELHPVWFNVEEQLLQVQHGRAIHLSCLMRDPQARFLVAAVGSLGTKLENRCRALAAQEQIYQSTLLDAVGTAMLDALDIRLANILDQRSRQLGVFAGMRFSPGLNGYPLEAQQILFQLVDATGIGVRLNASWIMKPAKSISFFKLLSRTKTAGSPSAKCSHCAMAHCQFRKILCKGDLAAGD